MLCSSLQAGKCLLLFKLLEYHVLWAHVCKKPSSNTCLLYPSQNMCTIEAELENLLGEFSIKMKGILFPIQGGWRTISTELLVFWEHTLFLFSLQRHCMPLTLSLSCLCSFIDALDPFHPRLTYTLLYLWQNLKHTQSEENFTMNPHKSIT